MITPNPSYQALKAHFQNTIPEKFTKSLKNIALLYNFLQHSKDTGLIRLAKQLISGLTGKGLLACRDLKDLGFDVTTKHCEAARKHGDSSKPVAKPQQAESKRPLSPEKTKKIISFVTQNSRHAANRYVRKGSETITFVIFSLASLDCVSSFYQR